MTKQEMRTSRRKLRLIALAGFIALVSFALSAHGQHQPTQAAKTTTDNMDGEEQEVAHPFFTHMGVPEAVGVFSLRLAGLATRAESKTDGDFAFHFETGLTKFVGLHVRNDSFLDKPSTEVMFQFAAVRSENGMSGFSPIIEFEVPTKSGGEQRINTLVGFSTALAGSQSAFNQVIHYNPREDMVDMSAAFVLKLGTRFFPAVEILGEATPNDQPIINLLGGLKVRVNESLLLGIALQAPVTGRKDFSWQFVFQPDIEWGTMK